MFFKSRTQRDVDDFKAMQDRDTLRIRQSKRSDQLHAATSIADAGAAAPSGIEKTGSFAVTALENVARGQDESVIGVNAILEGKLTTEGSMWLEGEVSGHVEAGETVFIARTAKVRADIRARKAIIAGDVEGQIVCREQLVVESGARLGGKVSTRTLVVEDGAVVHSEIHMVSDEDARQNRARGANGVPRPESIGTSPETQTAKAG